MATDLKFHLKIHSYITPLCQPTASSTADPSQGLFLNSLNFYTLLFLQFANILTFALQRTFTLSLFALFSGLIVFMMASLLLTCRTHPYIYKFTNAIILTLAGPATQYLPGSNIFFAMTFSFLSPSIILILFQQKLLAYLSFIAGYVFLNLFYLPVYQKTIINALMNDPDYTTILHFNSYNFIYIFNALLLYTSFSMNHGSGLSQSSSQPVSAAQNQFVTKFASHVETFMNQVLNNLNIALLEESFNKSKTYLTKAKIYGDALLSKARNVLDAEKNIESNPVPTKVTDLLEKIWSNSSEMIKRKGLFGTITLHKMVPALLMLDHHKVMQIVLSVIANAVRFTEKGDIDLALSWIDRDVITDSIFEPIPYDEGEGIGEGGGIGQAKTRTLGRGCRSKDEGESLHVFDTNEKKISDVNPVNLQNIQPRKGILKITITDTGSGISQKDAQGLVNLFIKGVQNKKTQQVRKSNMWMVDQLCQKMGGKVRFYSKPGEGVTCIICIRTEVPSREMLEQNPILEEVNNGVAPQRKTKGLLLDDNTYTSDTIKSYLEKCAVDVLHVARNKEELIETYEKEARQGKTIQLVVVNTQSSLPEVRNIHERLRNFETGRRLEPCTVLFISEAYTESQLKMSIDPNQISRDNLYIRSPIHFPELQKTLASVNSNGMQEVRENFHPKKIFIVNDNTFNLDLLARMLSMHGFDNLQALNGELAVEKYKTEWRDVACIFMDCQMPVMDGYEATRQIRKFQQMNKIPKIKILGVSGHVGAAHDEECREAGMDATVAMPFTADKIKKVATECLEEFQ